MIPWETLGRAQAPDGAELVLCRRGDELVIRAGGRDLMSSRMHGSEEALAVFVLRLHQGPSAAKVDDVAVEAVPAHGATAFEVRR